MATYILLITVNLLACHSNQSTTMNNFPDKDKIIKKLVNNSYGDLFNYIVRKEVAQKAIEDAGVEQLIVIIREEAAPMKARFFACEILEVDNRIHLAVVPEQTLAQIYAQALANNYTGYANSWGFLYEHDDEGTTGIMFLELWDKAVPALIPLLEDETQHLYHGSREATMGNSYEFRVKDFAAYYLSKITRIPVPYHKKHEDRDQAIEKLKEGLKEYKPD